MNIRTKIVTLLIFATFTASVLLLKGCTGADEPYYSGCPSGSVLANSTDTLTSTPDLAWTYNPMSFPGLLFGDTPIGPVTFTVTDADGNPRNNVCISFTTDGFWWTDENIFTTERFGSGTTNRITETTDPNGVVVLYWSTEPLPFSAPSPSTGKAGADQTGTSQVFAISGAVQDTFNINWTVKGCSGDTFGLGTCP